MMNNAQKILILIVALVAALAVSWSFYDNGANRIGSSTASSTDSSSTKVIAIDPNATSTSVGGYTIQRVFVDDAKPSYPSLDRVVPVTSNLTAQNRANLISGLNKTVAALKSNPSDMQAWMDLGVYRQNLGDYQGALEAWEFAGPVLHMGQPYENIGNLYATYLSEPTLAEANYKKAIALSPTVEDFYRNLADLYQKASNNLAAEATYKSGIAAIPHAVDLQVLLARYYKAQGDTADAKATYAVAISNAQSQGNIALAASIQQEASSI